MPIAGENIMQWYHRFQMQFGKSPTDRHMSAPGMPWIPITIADTNDGSLQTPKLHNALNYLAQQPADSTTIATPYIWNGRLTFWFSDNDAAVVFKLALPSL